MAITVIDISKYQGAADWDRIASAVWQGEIGAVIIHTSFGTTSGVQPDPQFGRNRDLARVKGVPHGFYHFAYPGRSSGAVQARALAQLIGPLLPGEVVALDLEDESKAGRSLVASDVAWAMSFMVAFKAATGVLPMLYVASSVLRRFDWSPMVDAGVKLWVANYGADTGHPGARPATAPWPKAHLWQYTQRAALAGFKSVDASLFDGPVADFEALCRPPVPPMAPVVTPQLPEEITTMFNTTSLIEAMAVIRAIYRIYGWDPDEGGPAGDEGGESYWGRMWLRAVAAEGSGEPVLRNLAAQGDATWRAANPGKD